MKHSYSPTCECLRCRREHGRRNRQAKAEHSRRAGYLERATGILGLKGDKLDTAGHWVVLKAGFLVDPDGGEVWEVQTYLHRYKARPCTLLVDVT